MFELSDFFTYCKNNEIDVVPYTNCPSSGATFRDGDWYAIFLDFLQFRTLRDFRGVCLHELGHVGTGALHKVDSPFETVERSEYRANRWAAEHYLTVSDFREAFAAGYCEPWQLSEYFDLPESDVMKAYSYWTESKGINFDGLQKEGK